MTEHFHQNNAFLSSWASFFPSPSLWILPVSQRITKTFPYIPNLILNKTILRSSESVLERIRTLDYSRQAPTQLKLIEAKKENALALVIKRFNNSFCHVRPRCSQHIRILVSLSSLLSLSGWLHSLLCRLPLPHDHGRWPGDIPVYNTHTVHDPRGETLVFWVHISGLRDMSLSWAMNTESVIVARG